jgi:hypothetical protein
MTDVTYQAGLTRCVFSMILVAQHRVAKERRRRLQLQANCFLPVIICCIKMLMLMVLLILAAYHHQHCRDERSQKERQRRSSGEEALERLTVDRPE